MLPVCLQFEKQGVALNALLEKGLLSGSGSSDTNDPRGSFSGQNSTSAHLQSYNDLKLSNILDKQDDFGGLTGDKNRSERAAIEGNYWPDAHTDAQDDDFGFYGGEDDDCGIEIQKDEIRESVLWGAGGV